MKATRGFTLIELLMVMAILSSFLLMLTQFLSIGIRVFDEGERGQALADRVVSAARTAEAELRGLQGPRTDPEPGSVDARLLVQWLPLTLVPQPQSNHSWAQLLRAFASLPPAEERRMLTRRLRTEAEAAVGNEGEAAVEAMVARLLAQTPLRGRCGMWLLPWPQGDREGAWMELRTLKLLPGERIEVERDRFVDPMTVPIPGGPELPWQLLDRITETVVEGVLHFELRFWSQRTKSWERSLQGGPEVVWDSCRAGWLSGENVDPAFGLDLGPQSRGDPSDDVYPHAVRCLMVVDQPPPAPVAGMLAEPINADDRSLRLVNPDRFPGPLADGMVKVGPEWMSYRALEGSELVGLQRGQRGTKARAHPSGTGTRVGRTVEFTVPLPFARDDWNPEVWR